MVVAVTNRSDTLKEGHMEAESEGSSSVDLRLHGGCNALLPGLASVGGTQCQGHHGQGVGVRGRVGQRQLQ